MATEDVQRQSCFRASLNFYTYANTNSRTHAQSSRNLHISRSGCVADLPCCSASAQDLSDLRTGLSFRLIWPRRRRVHAIHFASLLLDRNLCFRTWCQLPLLTAALSPRKLSPKLPRFVLSTSLCYLSSRAGCGVSRTCSVRSLAIGQPCLPWCFEIVMTKALITRIEFV